MSQEYNISAEQGATKVLIKGLLDEISRTGVDLSGYTAKMQVRVGGASGAILSGHDLSGTAASNPANPANGLALSGNNIVMMVQEDAYAANCVYDLELADLISGAVVKVMHGQYNISPAILPFTWE
jgi:uncharacterized protein (DUF1501 family)